MAAKKKTWLDEALAATDRKQFDDLVKRAVVRSLSERQARKVRPMFTTFKEGEDPVIDNDRMIESFMSVCLVDDAGERLIPEGREDEVADLPSYIYQALAMPVLAANGYSQGGNS